MQRWDKDTWLQDESAAYPNGGQARKGAAVYPDGKTRRIHAGIPDTWFSIPAHGRIDGRYVRGYVMVTTEDGSDVDVGQARWLEFHLTFTAEHKPDDLTDHTDPEHGGPDGKCVDCYEDPKVREER